MRISMTDPEIQIDDFDTTTKSVKNLPNFE